MDYNAHTRLDVRCVLGTFALYLYAEMTSLLCY